MQEMVEMSKIQSHQTETSPKAVSFRMKDFAGLQKAITVQAGPAHFGLSLESDAKVAASAAIVMPFRACTDILNKDVIKGNLLFDTHTLVE